VLAPAASAAPGDPAELIYAQNRETGDVSAIRGDRPTVGTKLTLSGPRITKLTGASPDGTRVAGLTAAGEFVTVGADGSNPVVFTPGANAIYTNGTYSGDGSRVLLTSTIRNTTDSQIVSVPADKSAGPTPVFPEQAHCDREITASGSNTYVFERGRLWAGACHRDRALALYDSSTGKTEFVTALDTNNVAQPLFGVFPSLSPDGRWLAYYEPEPYYGGGLLKVLDMTTKRFKPLSEWGGSTITTPRWALDSSMFHVDVNGNPTTFDVLTDKFDLLGTGHFGAAVPAGTVEPSVGVRVWGNDAIGTGVATSRFKFDAAATATGERKARVAVLTRSDAFYDGLAGSGLAGAKNGPMLLTPKSGLAPAVSTELKRVLTKGSTVYVLGGTGALSVNVENQVRALGFVPKRLAGAAVADTGVAIAREVTKTPSRVFVATAKQYYDALAGGAAAGSLANSTVVFTWGETLPAATRAYLQGLGVGVRVDAVGGPASRALKAAGVRTSGSLVGSDAADTARVLAAQTFVQPRNVALVTQETWQDALTGGALIAGRGPVLLTSKRLLSKATSTYLKTTSETVDRVVIVGGPLAIPQNQAVAATALTGPMGVYDMVESLNGRVPVSLS